MGHLRYERRLGPRAQRRVRHAPLRVVRRDDDVLREDAHVDVPALFHRRLRLQEEPRDGGCGACGAHYATDELGARDDEQAPSIEQRLEQGGKKIEGFAEKVGDAVTGLAAKIVNRPGPAPKRRVDVEPRASQSAHDDGKDVEHDLSHDDFADDTEMKFRKLEREEELRKRGGN